MRILPNSANKLTVIRVWEEYVARACQMEGWAAECRAAEEAQEARISFSGMAYGKS